MLLNPILNSLKVIRYNYCTKMSNSNCMIAVCQMTATNDKKRNLEMVGNLVNKAKTMKAQVVFLPEACDFICNNKKQTMEMAESLDGPLMTAYKDLALKNNVWLSIGGFHELAPELGHKTYNTHALIDNHGTLKSCYRKLHLFDVLIPEQKIDLRESKITGGGNEIVKPISTPAGNVGLAICYDLRFPELSTMLRKLGATLLTYPSAFTHTTGEAHWKPLLRARAIENQCYVVAAAQVGEHHPKRTSYGQAMIIDPWGRIIAELPKYSEKYIIDGMVAVAQINNLMITKIKQQMPVFDHRRPDVYTLKTNETVSNTAANDSLKHFKFSVKTIPNATVFYESNSSFAFTNIRCVLPGHVLIASKRVAPRLKDLTTDEVADLFQTAVKVQNLMEHVHKAGSTTLVVQDGPDAGQTIPHVHIHILPRKKGDFQRNDDIYEELARHDVKDSEMPLRDLSEMIEEAKQLKQLMNSENHI